MNNRNAWQHQTQTSNLDPNHINDSEMNAAPQQSNGPAGFPDRGTTSPSNDAGVSDFLANNESPANNESSENNESLENNQRFDTSTPVYATDSVGSGRSVSVPNFPNFPTHARNLPNLGELSVNKPPQASDPQLPPLAILSPADLLTHSARNEGPTVPPSEYSLPNESLPLDNCREFSQFLPEDHSAADLADKLISEPLSTDDAAELARLQKERDTLSENLEKETKRISDLETELAQNRMVWQDVEKRIQEETFRLESIVEEHPVLKRQITELKSGKYATYKRTLSHGLTELSRNYWQYGIQDHGDLTTNFHTALNVIENALTAIDQLQSRRAALESSIEQLVMRQHNLRVHLIDLIHDGSIPSPFDDTIAPPASPPPREDSKSSHRNPDQ